MTTSGTSTTGADSLAPTAGGSDSAERDAQLQTLFKEGFRRHAAGVAIITAMRDGVPYGFTATSVASLSAEPPRLTFNMALTSSSWPAVEAATHLGVHFLGVANQRLADRFARTRDRFDEHNWDLGPLGVPILHDVRGWLVGLIEARMPFDNNAVVVARIVDGGAPTGDDPTDPLLYHSGRYYLAGDLEYEI
ncbi:flavin-dependent reductase [Tersicoccus solisilvae]|uniref:Flavin-dependent reductase n=1 Tax=Tersicoccus solisilvae TaxID=1882339 RepID=A0ABQ1PCB9_9MICC|nr:flavin reductase family protein [Tersicoccus solisilvae]GGC94435.1 flavin-dependent reductase [Tersicoccus solisilvae]